MKLLFDFLPIVLFFFAYKMYDIYVATGVAIVATLLQVIYLKVTTGSVEKMHLITLAILVVMGGSTIIFHDDLFIKWKVTVINGAFALGFLGSQFIGSKNFTQRMMGRVITLAHHHWRNLNLIWAGFFTFSAVANWYVAFNFSTDTWVNFKLFGLMGLTLLCILLQIGYIAVFSPNSLKDIQQKD